MTAGGFFLHVQGIQRRVSGEGKPPLVIIDPISRKFTFTT